FRHPNLVTLLGWGSHQAQRYLVYELLSGGDAFQRLQKSIAPGSTHFFMWHERLSVYLDSALGLSHMHNHKPKAFHRDIKSANILLDKHGTAKMADFGLSCTCDKPGGDNLHKTVKAISGTPGYACPIYAKTGKVTEGSEPIALFSGLWLAVLGLGRILGRGGPAVKQEANRPGIVAPEPIAAGPGSTLEGLERQIKCSQELKKDETQVQALRHEYAVVLYQLMFSRTASARTAKQLSFVSRAKRRLTEATQLQTEAQLYLDSCVAQVLAVHEELAHAEDFLETFRDLEDNEEQDNERKQAEARAPCNSMCASVTCQVASNAKLRRYQPRYACWHTLAKHADHQSPAWSYTMFGFSGFEIRIAYTRLLEFKTAMADIQKQLADASLNRRALRNLLTCDAPRCCLAYFLHGAVLSADRAEELKQQEVKERVLACLDRTASWPSGVAKELAALSLRCVISSDDKLRPLFIEIVRTLRKMTEDYPKPSPQAQVVIVQQSAPAISPGAPAAQVQHPNAATPGKSPQQHGAAQGRNAREVPVEYLPAARQSPVCLELVKAQGLDVDSLPHDLRRLPLAPPAGSAPQSTGAFAAPVGREHQPELFNAWLPDVSLQNCVSRTAFEISWTWDRRRRAAGRAGLEPRLGGRQDDGARRPRGPAAGRRDRLRRQGGLRRGHGLPAGPRRDQAGAASRSWRRGRLSDPVQRGWQVAPGLRARRRFRGRRDRGDGRGKKMHRPHGGVHCGGPAAPVEHVRVPVVSISLADGLDLSSSPADSGSRRLAERDEP
ncbi:unnamed protein product, partial [Prorocentrum cordatum]